MKAYLVTLTDTTCYRNGEHIQFPIFRNIKLLFEYMEALDINIGISKHTFYAYHRNFAKRPYIPQCGIKMYANDYCEVRLYDI